MIISRSQRCEGSSVGRIRPFQGQDRGFESHSSLQFKSLQGSVGSGIKVRLGDATPVTGKQAQHRVKRQSDKESKQKHPIITRSSPKSKVRKVTEKLDRVGDALNRGSTEYGGWHT